MLRWVYQEDEDLTEDAWERWEYQVERVDEAVDEALAGARQESEGVDREGQHVEVHATLAGTCILGACRDKDTWARISSRIFHGKN